MKYLIIPLLLSITTRQNSQTTQRAHLGQSYWDSTSNWKIYQLHRFNRVIRTPIDSLKYLLCKPLNDDSVHLFLLNAKRIPATDLVWRGCYLASYKAPNGTIKKAIISQYAGFFYCQLENSYFQLDTPKQRDWLAYLSDSYVSIETKPN
jgi:hypothetical protein